MTRQLTEGEKSLLLYLETCAVDHGGSVAAVHMNDDDFAIVKEWNSGGFVQFGRIRDSDIIKRDSMNKQRAHWCRLSDEAWEIAHCSRRERAERAWTSRQYQTTAEKRRMNI